MLWLFIHSSQQATQGKRIMPLLYHNDLGPAGQLGLWQITETEQDLLPSLALSGQEKVQLARIKGHRRVEWLAVRRLVHDMSGRLQRAHFVKDEHGKPFLEDSDWEISISHSRSICAAIAGPQPVGIDIQLIVPKIERIAHKYMREEEMESLHPATRINHLHVYWGAKEALYKAYGRRQIDFCQHILIDPFSYSPEGGQFTGSIRKGLIHEQYALTYFEHENYVVVYAVLRPQIKSAFT